METDTIYLVEDDRAVRNLVITTLETHGYQYQAAGTGQAALAGILSCNPKLILLDLGLPDMDGMDIIKKVRGFSETPIIVLSARGSDRDKIEALDAGADDYLTKPFSTDELLARLRVALRRLRGRTTAAPESVFQNGELRLDYAAGCVYLGQEEIHLTPNEYKLLCLLSRNVGRVLTHNYLLKEIWGSTLPGDTQSLRVFMATLRKKIETDSSNPRYIQTHVGIGYRMLRREED